MRPKGNASKLEARRRLAMRLLDEGRSAGDVANIVGASVSSVRRWRSARNRRGPGALKAKPHPGPSRRLSKQQESQLRIALRDGDQDADLQPGSWNCAIVAEFIEARFGVVYHVDHVWRLLRQLGWTYREATGWKYASPNRSYPGDKSTRAH